MPCISTIFNPTIGPLLNVLIAPAGTLKAKANGDGQPSAGYYTFLVDTGAAITCLTPQIAAALGLQLMGKRDVHHAAGSAEANTFLADIGIPFGDPTKGVQTFVDENVTVMEFGGAHGNYQGLLGRDILCLGLLTMSGYDKRFTICM